MSDCSTNAFKLPDVVEVTEVELEKTTKEYWLKHHPESCGCFADEAELLPCPFCGSEYGSDHKEECYIPKMHQNRVAHSLGWEFAIVPEENLKEAWNKRYEPTCQKVPGKMKYGTRMRKCSNCGQSLGDDRWNYCPKCGCKVVD